MYPGKQLDHCLAHLVEIGAELLQHLSSDTLSLANQAKQDVLGADVVVTQLQGLAERELEHLLGPRGERDVTAGSLGALTDDVDDLLAHRVEADAHRLESLGGDALTLVDETEQDVLGADVVVIEQPSFLLGQDDDPASSFCESLKHSSYLSDNSGESLEGFAVAEYTAGPCLAIRALLPASLGH